MERDQMQWIDVRDFGVLGKAWEDTGSYYDRFPARAQEFVVPELWERSRDSSGLRVHFVTDSPEIAVNWTVLKKAIWEERGNSVCVSGLDLYFRHEGRWRWCSAVPASAGGRTCLHMLGSIPPGPAREFMLYLPIRNWVEKLSIGIVPGSRLEKAPPQPGRPICFYGTSIVHGAWASRPGMSYPAQLGRRLEKPFWNLGFGGQGRAEPEVAKLLAELDPCVYVIDPLPNLEGPQVTERIEPLVSTLRRAHPGTPIVLVENIHYADSPLVPNRLERWQTSNRALKAAYGRMISAGVKGLHYVEGDNLLGDDGEATIDGVHPTDLGFVRMADVLEEVLRPLVNS